MGEGSGFRVAGSGPSSQGIFWGPSLEAQIGLEIDRAFGEGARKA